MTTPEEFEQKLAVLYRDILALRFQMPQETPFCYVPTKMQEAAAMLDAALEEFREAWARGKEP